eukprot:g4531.t1
MRVMELVTKVFAIIVWVLGPFIDYVATYHRTKAMIFVVLPLSFVLRNVLSWRDWVYTVFFTSASGHADRVKRVSAVVSARGKLPEGSPDRKPMCTARAPWQNLSTRFSEYKSKSLQVFVGDFRNILNLDEKKRIVHIEPLVEVGQITRWLLPRGYMLATTLEIDEATVGGLSMAVGMTTASHKYGLLQETVVEYEMVMGDGKVLRVTKESHPDLFHALPWSHGSLGFLVGLKLRVIPVKPFVKLRYSVFKSQKDYSARIRELSLMTGKKCPDFVEATIFSKQEAVVMDAHFVDKVPSWEKANNLTAWYKPWFYKHIESFLRYPTNTEVVEYVETYTYIFRHNRAIFWSLRDQLDERVGNHWLFRLLLGWLLPPKVTFLKLPTTPALKEEMAYRRVYQDIVLPIRTIEEAVNKASDLFSIWPILVYPSRVYDHSDEGYRGVFRTPKSSDLVPGTNYAMYYDLGVYGTPPGVAKGTYKAVHAMREMEDYVRRVGGGPFLYADTFMTRDEFGEMFDLGLYEKVRAKYNATGNFPHLFEKTAGGSRLARWQRKLKAEREGTKKSQ